MSKQHLLCCVHRLFSCSMSFANSTALGFEFWAFISILRAQFYLSINQALLSCQKHCVNTDNKSKLRSPCASATSVYNISHLQTAVHCDSGVRMFSCQDVVSGHFGARSQEEREMKSGINLWFGFVFPLLF